MKKRNHTFSPPFTGALLGLALLLCLPQPGWSANLSFTSDTLLRLFERNDDKTAPGYEYLQVDAGALEEKGLSFHLYGWGRADLADSDYFSDQTAGELLYGYLEYSNALNNFDLKVGPAVYFRRGRQSERRRGASRGRHHPLFHLLGLRRPARRPRLRTGPQRRQHLRRPHRSPPRLALRSRGFLQGGGQR